MQYTEVVWFFNLNFVEIQKECTLGTKLIVKKSFLSEPSDCFASD